MTVTEAWLQQLPKAELHVHLEGTVEPATYVRIAQRNGVELPSDPSALFQCSGFEAFLQAFVRVVKTLRQPQDFAEITAEYFTKSAAANVRHVEFFFAPATLRHFTPSIDVIPIIGAIHTQCVHARESLGITSYLIFDVVRNLGEVPALADVDLAYECRDLGVVGIGLGGDERRFPARDFVKVFERAKRLGLRRTAHAGEAGSAQSVVDAIELLHAERIGHGVAAARDLRAIDLIRERNVSIDACITSNVSTGAWDGASTHAFKTFLDAGVLVSLSSDDPAFFGASLTDEYMQAHRAGCNASELVQLAANSFEASFATTQQKQLWLEELAAFVKKKGASESRTLH